MRLTKKDNWNLYNQDIKKTEFVQTGINQRSQVRYEIPKNAYRQSQIDSGAFKFEAICVNGNTFSSTLFGQVQGAQYSVDNTEFNDYLNSTNRIAIPEWDGQPVSNEFQWAEDNGYYIVHE